MSQDPALADIPLESLIAQVADEYMDRLKRGEQPGLEEFVERHPQHAGVIRNLLASLQFMHLSSAASQGMGSLRAMDVQVRTLMSFEGH